MTNDEIAHQLKTEVIEYCYDRHSKECIMKYAEEVESGDATMHTWRNLVSMVYTFMLLDKKPLDELYEACMARISE